MSASEETVRRSISRLQFVSQSLASSICRNSPLRSMREKPSFCRCRAAPRWFVQMAGRWVRRWRCVCRRHSFHAFNNIIHRVFLHQVARYGRERLADTCKQQPQIVVDFRCCSHRASRVARRHFLLDGDGGRQSFNEVAFRLLHTAEKLPGIR